MSILAVVFVIIVVMFLLNSGSRDGHNDHNEYHHDPYYYYPRHSAPTHYGGYQQANQPYYPPQQPYYPPPPQYIQPPMRYASARPDESGGSFVNIMALVIVMGAVVLFLGMQMGFVSGTIAFGKQQTERKYDGPITPTSPNGTNSWALGE